MTATASRSKRELTHERILDAASRAIRRAGHTGASVAEVTPETTNLTELYQLCMEGRPR